MIKSQPFYTEGLCFSCIRCSDCCRHESGYVFLSKEDASDLAAEFKMTYSQFVKKYCRWIPSANYTERLSLKEKSNYDCIFWDSGCKVYKSRPLQCRAFPFWPNILKQKESWEKTGEECPGINRGELHKLREIEEFIESQAKQPIITRDSSPEVA